ncbi:MAG: hypothetical protein P8N31_08455 [Planctomycetota bacterium]|nr:hypothetical protein [Planctomycetota bacterium]MDG2143571.1 hypothetical protein [Planctomycetota bacterium]
MLCALIWSALLLSGLAFGWQSPVPLAWAALLSPCAGWHLGCTCLGERRGFVVLQMVLALLAGLSMVGEVAPMGAFFAWCALAGLSALPFWLAGRFCGPESADRGLAAVAALSLFVSVIPTGAGLLDRGWAKRSPRLAGLAMDATPAVFVMECAGLDVFRMPMFYDSDTTDFVMDIRRPWDAPLAPLVLLVLGYGLVALPRELSPAKT